jgi:hypothetical protein
MKSVRMSTRMQSNIVNAMWYVHDLNNICLRSDMTDRFRGRCEAISVKHSG